MTINSYLLLDPFSPSHLSLGAFHQTLIRDLNMLYIIEEIRERFLETVKYFIVDPDSERAAR